MIYNVASILLGFESGSKGQVSLMAMILALILIPAQSIAEEYVFRGFFMQTFGSWFKNPYLAIIIQAIILLQFIHIILLV